MNLTDQQVEHEHFRQGTVTSVDNGRITIEFSEDVGKKSFQYPGAFDQYLKMCDSEAQEFVKKDLAEFEIRSAAEKAERERKYQEEQERIREEQLALKKAAAKKPSVKKAAKAKPVAKTVKKAATKKAL